MILLSTLVAIKGVLVAGLIFIGKSFSRKKEEYVEPIVEPVVEVYIKWDEDTNFIMAFIAEHFKTSNVLLMEELSSHLGRSTSSITRKISRLRGIKTNKSPYASDIEREFVQSLDGSAVNDKGYCKLLMLALINIGLNDDDIMNLQDLMVESEPTN